MSGVYFLDTGLGPKGINGKIVRLNPDGSNVKELITGMKSLPDGIVIDKEAGFMYWTNMGIPNQNDGFLSRSKLDGSDVVTIVAPGVTHTPKQLALVKEQKKLYWCDREGFRIFRANLDGSNPEVLLQTGTDPEDRDDFVKWCVGIAVDAKKNVMYWTQKGPPKGGKGRLFRAPIDIKAGETPSTRSDVEVLFDNLPEPIDIHLDEEDNILYWTDRGDVPFGNAIYKSYLDQKTSDGKLEKTILLHHIPEAIGLAVDKENDRLYVGGLGGYLFSAKLSDGSDKKFLYEAEAITGVAFVK